MGMLARGGLAAIVLKWASRLRFPWLFLLTASLFVLNLFIPDVLPFVDEILMGLLAMLLASWKKRNDAQPPAGTGETVNKEIK